MSKRFSMDLDGLSIMLETILPQEMRAICRSGDTTDDRKYYYIRGANGKAWLFPCVPFRLLKVALAIYQPVVTKGRGFKLLFPVFASNRVFRKLIGRYIQVTMVGISLRDEFTGWIEEVFQVRDPILSFYMGYPNPIHKSTCQVSDRESNILGYAKFSGEIVGSDMIRAEADFLEHHAEKVSGLPKPLGFSDDLLGLTILAQTTIKTRHDSQKSNILNQQHMRFLQQLREKTKVTMTYRDTRYYLNQQRYLQTVLDNVALEDREIIQAATDIINGRLGNARVEFSVAHRDFKPPNICLAGGQIMVFDWELAAYEYPPFYDLFSFVTFFWEISGMSPEAMWLAAKNYILDMVTRSADYTQDELELYHLMYQTDSTLLSLSLNPESSIHNDARLIKEFIKSGRCGFYPI